MRTIGSVTKRAAATGTIACLIVIGGPVAARAARPAVRACVGHSLSAVASASTQFGQFVSSTARDPTDHPGIGDAVQALQAGQVPDSAFPNTCN